MLRHVMGRDFVPNPYWGGVYAFSADRMHILDMMRLVCVVEDLSFDQYVYVGLIRND